MALTKEQTAFLDRVGAGARADGAKSGVLASLTVAQAILESGWGTSGLAVKANALFGIKATAAWRGKVFNSDTKECYDGVNYTTINAAFRAYGSWEESIADHSDFLNVNSRYKAVIGEKDYKKACTAIKAAGYATAPDYAETLMQIIETYSLTRYDKGDKVMNNSPLIKHTKISPNSTNPRTGKISKITIHCMAGNMTVENCGEWFGKSSTAASSNYGIGGDGRIGLYVDEKNRAWTSGGTKTNAGLTGSQNDQIAVTIEVANDGGEPDWHISNKAYAALLDLVTDIAERNEIYPVTFTGDSAGTLTAHRWYAAKACPGDYIYNHLPEIAKEVTKRLAAKKGVAPPAPPTAQTPAPASPKPALPYTVRVTAAELNIRAGAGTNYAVKGAIKDKGVYTIVEEASGAGAAKWGKLKSGAGWIALDFTTKN